MEKIFRSPITYLLLVSSVAVSLLSGFGKSLEWAHYLFIVDIQSLSGQFAYLPGLQDIQNGQVWRIVTPILLHFSLIHLLFNMLWLLDLGRVIEDREGSRAFVVLVLLFAIPSNFSQYLVSGPLFGGMSGVVYGLLGYLWIRGRFDPNYGILLKKEIVGLMLIWFVICLVGVIPNVANMAHGIGLVMGMLLGIIRAKSKTIQK